MKRNINWAVGASEVFKQPPEISSKSRSSYRFRKFHKKKHLHWSLFLLKLQAWRPAQVFSCKICKIFKNTYFEEHLRMTASEISLEEVFWCFQRVSKEINDMKWVNKFIIPKMFAEFFVPFCTGFMWFWYLRGKALLLKSYSCKWWNAKQWGQKTTDYLQSSRMRKLYRSTQRLWRFWKNELMQRRFTCWINEANLQKDM